jgi:hypothetical protein
MPANVLLPERRQRPARKIDRDKVQALHSAGMSTADIAQHQQVARRTIQRFLASIDAEKQAIDLFKSHRADVFATLQAESLEVQASIVRSLMDDGVLASLTPHQKASFLAVLSAQHGTLYDKERLERGQSTSNVSVIHKLMGEAFKRAGQPTTDSGSEPAAVPEESSS